MLPDLRLKVLRLATLKPCDMSAMEFRYGLWEGVSSLYSESGRQLGEGHTCPASFNDHVPAERVVCNYDGSRRGQSINLSALRPAMKSFAGVLELTVAVRSHHLRSNGAGSTTGPIGIWDLNLISRASIALIAHRARYRRARAPATPVSAMLTAQFQFISGIFMICRKMLASGCLAIRENIPISAQDLYAYAEQNKMFLSRDGMVCAGSKRHILRFLDVCCHGQTHLLDMAQDDRCRAASPVALSAIVADPANWYQYACRTVELDCFIEIERLSRKLKRYPELRSQIEWSIASYAAMADHVRDRSPVPLRFDAPDEDFMTGAVERQNAILSLLGRKGIRSLSRAHVHARIDANIDRL